MVEKFTTEQMAAIWRGAQRVLDETDPFVPGRAELEARVEEARLRYLARVDELRGTAEELTSEPLDHSAA